MIIKSYINNFLNKVEDPEKLLDQALSEMEENYRRSKVELAKAVADEVRLKKKLTENTTLSEEWEVKAVLAVKKGNDDLAREALKLKARYDEIILQIGESWKFQKEATDNLKNSLKQLQMKIDEAKRKRNLLVTRQQRALLQKKIYTTINSANGTNPLSTLNQMEEKIANLEAESEAIKSLGGDSLDEKFNSLQANSDLEKRLSELKKKYLKK